MAPEQSIYRPVRTGNRLFQGEILQDVDEWVPAYDVTDPNLVASVSQARYPFAVVMTQDCDLAQDWLRREALSNAETDLSSVLLCRAAPAESAFASEANLRGRDLQKPIKNNKNERYQYLIGSPVVAGSEVRQHPALLMDFKSVFSVRTSELYRQIRVGAAPVWRGFALETPWAEHLQCRFAWYHARIGLPHDHFVPEARRSDSTVAH